MEGLKQIHYLNIIETFISPYKQESAAAGVSNQSRGEPTSNGATESEFGRNQTRYKDREHQSSVSFKDSDDFLALISKLNRTLESLKYQEEVFQSGKI